MTTLHPHTFPLAAAPAAPVCRAYGETVVLVTETPYERTGARHGR
jgi:hypothetical protein